MMEGLFKIVPMEGKGVGWIALQDIKIGTLILSEKCQFEPKIQNDLWSLMECFFSMTTMDQKDFLKLSNLFWENPDFLESRKVDYDNWMAFANHYSTHHSSKNPEVDGELVLKIICIFESNKSFGAGGSVAIKNSMINHSCCANAFSFKRNGNMEVRTTHKIKEGQEITTNYDLHWQCVMQKRKRRQEVIRAEYGFNCCCELCQDEEINDDEESYEMFRKITDNMEILNNIIEFETETMKKSPGEFKKSCYSEILKSVEKRQHCFTELYNFARNKKVPKDYILHILEGSVQCLYFGIKICKQAEQYNLFIDEMKYFEEKVRILVKIGLKIAKMCYGNDYILTAKWNNRVETLM